MITLCLRDGTPVSHGREWTPMLVEVDLPDGAWEDARLFRNQERLELARRGVGGRMGVVAEWPRAGCGSYLLRLVAAGEEHALTVRVFPRKIGPAAFVRLLDDLEARLPASVALALQRTGGLAGVALLPPGESTLAEEVHRLRRGILGTERRPGLAAVLHELSMDPHRVLRPAESWTPADQARRPSPARLAHALVHGRNLRPDGKLARVLDARVEHETDVYENRLVNAYVLLLERRIRWLAPAVRKRGSKPVEREVERLAHALREARRRAAFLDGVGELGALPDRVSMVLLNRPAYRAALDGYLELHRRIAARFEDPALDAPLENLPYLYQIWGTLQVIRALLDTGAELGWVERRQGLATRTRDGVVVRVLQNGEPALVLAHPATGAEASVIPQPTYGGRGTRDVRSFTYDQKPDVAVVVRRPGERPRLWLFDPKYKLDGEPLEKEPAAGKPMKVDIDKMHAYRDAIRHESGEQVVEYAAIMYPGPEMRYDDVGIDALSAVPGDTRAMEHRLEAVLRRALGGST